MNELEVYVLSPITNSILDGNNVSYTVILNH